MVTDVPANRATSDVGAPAASAQEIPLWRSVYGVTFSKPAASAAHLNSRRRQLQASYGPPDGAGNKRRVSRSLGGSSASAWRALRGSGTVRSERRVLPLAFVLPLPSSVRLTRSSLPSTSPRSSARS